MAEKCTHCGKAFSCGCQKTKDKNGKLVHKKCKASADKK